MKVSRIEIKDFQQFKDFELDLTYPEGHPKAGQPLDKVCFIGQSGTGKTTILRFVNNYFHNLVCAAEEKYVGKILGYLTMTYIDAMTLTHTLGFSVDVYNPDNYDIYNVTFNDILAKDFYDTEEVNNGEIDNSRCIYFPAELVDNIMGYIHSQLEVKNPLENIKTLQEIEKIRQSIKDKIGNKHSYDFSKDNPTDIWYAIYFDIIEYEDDRKNFDREISQAMLNKNYELAEKLTNNLQVWLLNNNPLEKIARIINPIVSKFGVEIDTKATYKNSENIFIRVNVKKDSINVPYKNWSTGTKQIILLATPLIQLDTKNAIILIDEPERSLFPDIQRTLINYYTDLAPEAQFFFATHSPIIASQFEPCERFILTFDEETGFVKAHRGIAPEGDDANDLLSKDFATEVLTPKGVEKYQEFLRLRGEIRKETNPAKKDELSVKYFELANEYNFKLPSSN